MKTTSRLIFLVASMIFASHALGKVSGNFTITSDYLWRGESFSNNGNPALQGGMGYENEDGSFDASSWFSSSAPYKEGHKGITEATYNMNYRYKIQDDFSVFVNAYQFHYDRYDSAYDYFQGSIGMTWKNFKLMAGRSTVDATIIDLQYEKENLSLGINYTDDIFLTGSSDTYYRVTKTYELEKNLHFVTTLGYSVVGDEKKRGHANYLNYHFSLEKTTEYATVAIFHSDTNRELVDAQGVKSDIDDTSIGLTAVHRF